MEIFELEVVGSGNRWLRVMKFGRGRSFTIFLGRDMTRWWFREWRIFADSEVFSLGEIGSDRRMCLVFLKLGSISMVDLWSSPLLRVEG